MMRRILVLAACVWGLGAASLSAQDESISQAYGNGVHAYFRGNMQEAVEQLTMAIDAGFDARALYFRGLALAAQGDCGAAEGDFSTAAQWEAEHSEATTSIGRALQRVQGSRRQQIEKLRLEAKVRMAQMRKLEAEARGAAGEAAAKPEAPAKKPAAKTPAVDDAFGEEEQKPAAKGEEAAPEEKADAAEEKMPAKEGAEDLFGEEEQPPAKKPAGKKPVEKPEAEAAPDAEGKAASTIARPARVAKQR